MQSIVKTVLDRFLGPYCDFQGDINVDMWSGKAVLRHVKIKPEMVSSIGLPIDIKSGYIDRISLVCDWRSGFNKPVEVELSHVYAVVSPRSDFSELDLEKIRKDTMQAKRNQKAAELKDWEDGQFDPQKGFVGKLGRRLLRIEPSSRKQSIQEAVEYTSPENMTKLEKLIAKIMANLRIKVSNVHIRLESESDAVGVKVREFSVLTTDELFKPTFIAEIGNVLFKAIALEGFLVYVNSGSSLRSKMEKENLAKDEAPASEPQFRYVLRTELEEDKMAFLLNPVSFIVHVTMQQRPTEKIPKMKIDAYLDRVKIAFTSSQYRSILRVNNYMSNASEHLKQLIGKEIYAEGNGDSNLVDIDREYFDLYRRTLHVPSLDLPDLTKQEEARLTTLELSHTAQEIEFYRKSVLNELDEYLVRKSGQVKYEIFRKRDVTRQSGFGSILSWFKASKSEPNPYAGLLPTDTEIDTIIDSPIVEENNEKALSTIFTEMSFKIPEISLTLIGDRAELLHGAITGSELKANAFNVSSFDVEMTVTRISVLNLLVQEAAFPEILYPSSTDTASSRESPLLKLLFRANPIDLPAKFAVFGGIEPIDVVVDYVLIQNVSPFFMYESGSHQQVVPTEHSGDSLNIISSLTASSPKDVALLRRPTVIVDLKISAPTILIPQRPCDKNTLLLVIDLGCFLVSTRPSSSGAAEVDFSGIDMSDIKDIENPVYKRFYDNFTLEYTNLQIFFSEHGKDWRSFIDSESTQSNLLCPVSSSLFIGLCVLVDSGPLATLVVNVHFKPLSVQMSPSDLKELMVLSAGLQQITQTQIPAPDEAKQRALSAKSPVLEIAADQAIPSDLAAKLSGKETDIDAFVNIFLDSLHIAISVDSRTIIDAAIDGVALDLTRRSFDTMASFSIHDMHVEECLSGTKLIRSYLSTAMVLPADIDSRHFIYCRYKQTDRASPNFKETDHFVEIFAGLVELNLEPTSLFETALFIKNLLDCVSVVPKTTDNVDSGYHDRVPKPNLPQASSVSTESISVFSVHPKFDGVMLRVCVQKNPLMEVAIRQVFCDITQDISGCIKLSTKLDTIRIEDCLSRNDSVFRHILIPAEELPQLFALDVEYFNGHADVNCKLDAITLLVRAAFIQELLDLVQYSPFSRISSVFARASTEEVHEEADTEVSEVADRALEIKPGRLNIEFGQLQVQFAPDDTVDRLLTVSVKNASARTKRSEIAAEVQELRLLVSTFNRSSVVDIISISWMNVTYDALSPQPQPDTNAFMLNLDSSPLSLLAGTKEYLALLDLYNDYIEVKPVIVREAYNIIETPVSLPALHKSIAAVMPAINLTVSKAYCKMLKNDNGMDLALELSGIFQVSLQSVSGNQDAVLMGSGFSFDFDMNSSKAWNSNVRIDAMHINRQAGDLTMNILLPTDLSLSVQAWPHSESNNALNVEVEADQLHVALSYSSILLCRSSAMIIVEAFNPVLDSLRKHSTGEESGDAFPVPMKIDIPVAVEKEESIIAWNLLETFTLSLKSIRIDVTNDIMGSAFARRIPVLEALILIDPQSEGHGYGSVRHIYLGMLLSVKVYNSKVSAWEPLIEPTAITITSRQTVTLHELNIGITDKCNVNISDRMLASFMDSYQTFLTALTARSALGKRESLSLATPNCVEGDYMIQARNDLEIGIKLFFEEGKRTKEFQIDQYSTKSFPVANESTKLHLSFGTDWLPIKDVSIGRVGTQSFWVLGSKALRKNSSVRIITEVVDTGSSKMLLIHSDRQIQNHGPVTVNVAGFEIQPDKGLWLPAFNYDPSSILYITVPGSKSKSSLDFLKEKSLVSFDIGDDGRLVCLLAEGCRELCNSYVIHLRPTRVIQNLLPIPCTFSWACDGSWKDEATAVGSGNHFGLTVNPSQELQIKVMLPFMDTWSFPLLITANSSQVVVVKDRHSNQLKVNVEAQMDKILVFVGYWVYDLVQLPDNLSLQISSEQFENVPAVFPAAEFVSKSGQLEPLIEPLMFHSGSGRAFLRLSSKDSKWSDPFSITAAGSSDIVTVRVGSEAYQFNVNTSLCAAPYTRTKMVVFTPRYIVVNSLHFPIVYKQCGDSLEFRVDSGETRSFFKWPNFELPQKLCFKRDDACAHWTNPISIADVTDETLVLQGRNWSRLARLEVQRGNSSFLVLSHQKPSLVPLVILNRSICVDVWARQTSHLNWQHISPESGYPFGFHDGPTSSVVSFKFGRMTASGAEIVQRIEVDLSKSSPFGGEIVFSWNDSAAHDIVVTPEQRGPFSTITVSERIRSRDALCSAMSTVHSRIDDLVSRWTAKKIGLTELDEESPVSDRYLQLTIVECSHLDVPKGSKAVYLSATAFQESVQTPVVDDVADPYFDFKHSFAAGSAPHHETITISVHLVEPSDTHALFCKFSIVADLDNPTVDSWFNLEMHDRTVGQIHVSIRIFESKRELLRYELHEINSALLKQQDTVKHLDDLVESVPVAVQMQSDLVADPNQSVAFLEFQILPIEVRGVDVPRLDLPSRDLSQIASIESGTQTPAVGDSGTISPTEPRPAGSHRLICEFRARVAGPDKDSQAAAVLTNWNGEQVARILKESFSFRVFDSASTHVAEIAVEITLKLEQRERGRSVRYRVLDRVLMPLSQVSNETWVKFESGNNEILLSVARSSVELRQRDLVEFVQHMQLYCNQIGVSLVDRMSREILYVCVQNTLLDVFDTANQLGLSVCVGALQADNQMREALYPVVVFPKRSGSRDKKSIPWLQVAVVNLKDKQNEGFTYLLYLSVLLQETNFFVEEELLWGLYEYANDIADIVKPVEPVSERHLGLSLSDYSARPEPGSSTTVFIKTLMLHPVALNLTFQPDLTRREEGRLRLVSRYANPIDMLLGAAGVTLGAIKEAPIRIDSLEVFDVFGSGQTFLAPIRKHYLIQLLQQAYKLLGSLSVLGNPVGLVSNLGQGVKHLFYDPAQGLISSPMDFGKGLATGSTRFVQHTVGGVLSSAGQITSSLGTGVAVLTMDRAYLEKREKDERHRIREAVQGTESHNVATGLMAFGSGLIGGLRGAVEKPVAGLKKGGALGFVKGIVKGGAGLIAQPLVGVIDLGTHTVQGIQGVIGRPTRLRGACRCRLPRFLTKSGVLEQYSVLSAKGQSVLWASAKRLEEISIPLTRQQRQQEALIACKEIRIGSQPDDGVRSIDIVLTSFRIIVAEFSSDWNPPDTIRFSLGLDQIDSVSHSPADDAFSLELTDGRSVRIQTRSPAEADDVLVWIVDHLQDCTPVIRHATYGAGNCWITITDLLQDRVASLGRVAVLAPAQIEQMVAQQSRDFFASCAGGRLWVEYTRGPDLITAEFDLVRPIAF